MNIDYDLLEKLTGVEDRELLTFYTEAIIEKIEKIIGYQLESAEKTEKIRGIDKNIIYLTRRPVTAIKSILIDNKDATFFWSENQNYALLNEIICCNFFVEVTYTAGYTELPKNLMMLISGLIKNEIASLNSDGLKSYKIKDVSYTWIDGLQNDNLFLEKVSSIFGMY